MSEYGRNVLGRVTARMARCDEDARHWRTHQRCLSDKEIARLDKVDPWQAAVERCVQRERSDFEKYALMEREHDLEHIDDVTVGPALQDGPDDWSNPR